MRRFIEFYSQKEMEVDIMCFRPPSAGKPIKCPSCGALNPSIAKNCVKCKADLSAAKEEQAENKDNQE